MGKGSILRILMKARYVTAHTHRDEILHIYTVVILLKLHSEVTLGYHIVRIQDS